MDQLLGKIFQLIAIAAFLYGTLTTFGQPLLGEQYSMFFFPRWFFNWAPGLVIGSVLGLILMYLNKQSNMKKK
ncbi:unnamed protein product (macronuclear) [Paramecium tetraurelia]|uniref:Dolichol phosphate-mannose biosynthesis regulatory protein n=1 Tax=Paramecium tetraurelia TaxID=5888 RepID=A0DBY0_PARTE|nr:uncharacterized protein GSPATT00015424001 [Paramecium tetraurelia]CAK80547.1 unnamed protein product [Paramecium tetraurelia]|eukprot:XP_001447944.1 hypothetical protein (macronuclear) [Paramecium tetraurelia strain d4-2]